MAVGLEMSADTDLAAVAVARGRDRDRDGDGDGEEVYQVDLVFYGPPEGAVGEAARACAGPGAGLGGCQVYLDPMPCAGLLDPLRMAGVRLHLLEAVDVAASSYEFRSLVRGHRVTAGAHEALRAAMQYAQRRPLATAFAFERRRVEVDMSPLNAAAFGLWGLLHGQAPFFATWR